MMRSLLLTVLLATMLSLSQWSHALVEPLHSSLSTQPWFAQIYVDNGAGGLKEFCKGALINSQWILTSGYCIYDPFEATGLDRDTTGARYFVKFAGSGLYYDIEKFVQSDDLAAGMMKLKEPVTIAPVAISTKTEVQLRNTEVIILGQESSEAVGDIYFNPDIGKRMYCRVDGQVYYRSGAVCYVLPKLTKSASPLQSRGTVIDPRASGSPNTSLDRYHPFDMSGKRLYLDFRADRSYPCDEDLGAPVLRVNANGSVELVGIVSAVGMANGFPLCSPTIQNIFGAASWYQDFIDETMAQEGFDQLCPDTPQVKIEYPGGRNVKLSWPAVDGATGYRLLYTANVGYAPFLAMDLGAKTEVATEISPEPIYRVVLVAYNDVCSSPPTDEQAVYL